MNWQKLDLGHLLRWLVNAMVLGCGLLSGALLWKVYDLVYYEGIELPMLSQVTVAEKTDIGWGSWLDLTKSRAPDAPKIAQPKKVAPKVRPITNKIDLAGVIGFGTSGAAIMRVDGAKELVYSQGDLVAEGVKLVQIMINGVVVSNGKSEKTVVFPEAQELLIGKSDADTSGLPQASLITPVNVPSNQPQTRTPTPAPTRQPVKKTTQARPTVAPKVIQQQLEDIEKQPLKAASLANYQLVNRNGKIYGVRVSQFKERQLLQAIGLLPNDIVTSINGVPISRFAENPALIQQTIQSVTKTRRFSGQIIRNGKSELVTHQW